MKKVSIRKIIFTFTLCLLVTCFAMTASAKNGDAVVILYENDVHCAVEGYSTLAAMKNELCGEYEHVAVVSSGDYIQGGTLGAISKGGYIVELMNLVGYDALTLGNHEFDYKLDRLDELVSLMDTKPVCCNFCKIGEKSYFSPYSIVSYGKTDVAYIGIITPSTISSATPSQFKNEDGEFIYSFCNEELYRVVQENVNKAKSEGADVVIALSHVGDDEEDEFKHTLDIIRNTYGIDVFLDGHSHSVIEGDMIENVLGEEVLLTSTGTGFEHIGKLTIDGEEITSQLIKTETYGKRDETVDEYLAKIKEEYSQLGDRVIAVSECDLVIHDDKGNRIIRTAETNLGRLFADAAYTVTGADIGYVNGGGVRAPIAKGDVTFNDIYSVLPFSNYIVVAEIHGSVLLNFLEAAFVSYPSEGGYFPHVTGMTMSVDTSIPTSVVVDENESFICVDGEYRVYDVKILNRETGEYEPLEPDKTYTIAAIDFIILSYGGGMSMFKDAVSVTNDGLLDVECIERYMTEHLGGVIGKEYEKFENRITFTDGKITETDADFFDLPDDAWYSDSVNYVVNEGIMTGVGEKEFAPFKNLTRAMLVTMLYRAEGEPATNRSIPFGDVDMGAYYAPAVSWAKQNGIVTGVTENEFCPSDLVTREQLAAIMLRYADFCGMETKSADEDVFFEDAHKVSEYALSAMSWAVDSGIINGKTENKLCPKDNTTRAEVAVVFHRFFEIAK